MNDHGAAVLLVGIDGSDTSLRAGAYAAGMAVGYWSSPDEIVANGAEDRGWEPGRDEGWRERELRRWRKAVARTMDWMDDDERAALHRTD